MMKKARVDFSKSCGKIKPMHAVNNGPVYKFGANQRISNMEAYMAAGIPYARTHDSSFYSNYGGEHTVDINAIFPNFDADAYDEASYDFTITDEYMRVIDFSGTKIFYRLGYKIEHEIKKYNILPPKDFKKWAVICEHIIRHYNYGWADGFHYNIEYWEIWNEADDPNPESNRLTWGGTKEQFFELYNITANHLKTCFPELKIGGPAAVFEGMEDWNEEFLERLETKPDFYSWHIYAADPRDVEQRAKRVREMLDKNGYTDTESILNEWNYVRGWEDDDWIYTKITEKNMKGAAYIASVMAVSQNTSIDLLMYYDARPCGMNGMFSTDMVSELLKGYYPFYMFNQLYKLGSSAQTEPDEDIYLCAAQNGSEGAILITHYSDDDAKEAALTELEISGFSGGAEAEIYVLDEEHDMELIRKERTSSGDFSLYIDMPLQSSVLIKLKRK